MLKEHTVVTIDTIVTIPAKAEFASGEGSACFYRVVCGGAVITVPDMIDKLTLIEKTPHLFAVFSLPENEYTVYITTWREWRPAGKTENMAASSPPNSLFDLVTLRQQVFQILDSGANLVAEYKNGRVTLSGNAPQSDIDMLFGCMGMLHLIVAAAGNAAGI
jgi:hypothetical protein